MDGFYLELYPYISENYLNKGESKMKYDKLEQYLKEISKDLEKNHWYELKFYFYPGENNNFFVDDIKLLRIEEENKGE
jgi:hypothetical protein